MPHKSRSSVTSNTTPHIKPTFFPSEKKSYTYILFGVCGSKVIYKVTAAVTLAELVDAILVTAFFNIYTKSLLRTPSVQQQEL